jgi:outer membrane protein assembly factor BamB
LAAVPFRPLRRSLRIAAIAACFIVAASGSRAATEAFQEATDWPMAGKDPAHSGEADGPVPPYREAWRATLGGGGPVAGPIVAAGLVVVVTDREVRALDAGTGRPMWKVARSAGDAGVPAASGDLVVHASGGARTGTVVARTIVDGTLQWRTNLGSAVPGPIVIGQGLVFAGTADGFLVGLDLASGEERFRFEAPGAIAGAPALSSGLVLASWEERGTGRATVRAFELHPDGQAPAPLWQITTDPGLLASAGVSVGRGTVFVAAGDGSVRAVEPEGGVERWVVRLPEVTASDQIPLAGPALIVADRLHVSALDPASGEERWSYRLADGRNLGGREVNTLSATTPAVVGSAVVLGDATGLISAIDLRSGRRVWRADIGNGATAPPAAGGDLLYVATLGSEGELVALEHDVEGRLLDEVSDTVLSPVRAVLNFLVAAASAFIIILGTFRYLLGGRRAASEQSR